MKRIAVVLALTVLVLAGWLLLQLSGGEDREMLEEQGGAVQEEAVGRSGEVAARETGLGRGALDLRGGPRGQREAVRRSLESGRRGEIAGQVVDQLSEPVAGIAVLLYRARALEVEGSEAPVLARVQSDEKGEFRIEGLELGTYTLRALAKGWGQGGVTAWLSVAEPKRLGLRLEIREGGSVDGVVVGADGKAVANAWVVASWSRNWGGEPVWPEARTDAEGRFSFASLPQGKVYVQAWSEGRMMGRARGVVGQSELLRVELPQAGPYKVIFRLSEPDGPGQSKPDDVSIKIRMYADNLALPLPRPIRMLQVPAQGEVSTRGLMEGEYNFFAKSEEVALRDGWREETLGRQSPEIRVSLDWSRKGSLHGRLLSKSGRALPGVVLQAWRARGTVHHAVKSDAQGRFRFSQGFHASTRPWITIESPGFLFDDGQMLSAYARGQPGEAENLFTLVPVPVLSGRVIDDEGVPVPGAWVWLHPKKNRGLNFGRTIANEQGEFRLSQAQETGEPLLLDAKSGSAICLAPLPLEVGGQSSREGIVLRLVEGGSIEGRVVDVQGTGIAGAEVMAAWLSPARSGTGKEKAVPVATGRYSNTFTNRQGRFRLVGLEAGSWQLNASSDRLLSRNPDLEVVLARGMKRKGLRLVLGPGSSITGRVVSDQGQPLSGLSILARLEDNPAKGDAGGVAVARTGNDGEFVLEGLRAGKFLLEVELPRRLETELGLFEPGPDGQRAMRARSRFQTRVVAGSKDYRWKITLPRFGEIRASFAQRGRPLRRVQVELRAGKERWAFDMRVVDGVLSMKRVLAGSYELRIQSMGSTPLKRKIQVRANQVSDLGVLSLPDLAEVDGRVVDEKGQALAGVWIGLDPKLESLWPGYATTAGREPFEGRVWTQSDASGRFRVPIGKRTKVYAFKPGYAPQKRSLSPPGPKPEGKRRAVSSKAIPRLVLHPAGEITVQAPSVPKGQASQWEVLLSRIDGAPVQAGSGLLQALIREVGLHPGKPVRILGLPPGRYRLQAADFARVSSYSDNSIPGKSYHEEVLIQLGANPPIKIP